jgi:conjugal transfer pilus assembly protein TraK
MVKKILIVLTIYVLFSSHSYAEHIGGKECAMGAVNSGDQILQTCVDAPDTPGTDKRITTASTYDPQSIKRPEIKIVYPEVTTAVEMSSTDVNRIICPVTSSEVNVIHSTEKGMITKVVENNVFVKFSIIKKKEGPKEELIYRDSPAELYVVCGGEVFSMIVIPKQIPTQTIKLSSGEKDRIKKNIEMMAGLPLEEKIIKMIQAAYKDDIPNTFTVEDRRTDMGLYEDVSVVLRRVISADGTGLRLLEYDVRAVGSNEIHVNETTFMRPELAGRIPLAIALEEHTITERPSRLFIVQMVKEVEK